MSEQNIVNVMVIPDVPKVLPGEQLYVYVPKASFTSPGIIAYNDTQFEIDGNFLFIREDYVSPGVQQKIAELKQYTDDKLQLKQDKEDDNISLAQRPEQKSVVGAINDLGTLTGQAQDTADDAIRKIGDLSTLTTDEKTTIVDAINEVDEHADANKAEIGNLSALTTDEKATLVGAINEVDAHTNTAQQAADAAQATADNATTLANTGISKADRAQTTANTAVDKANDAKATAQEAIMKADGRATSIGFMTAKDAVTALNGYPRNQLKGGDTIWIVEDGTPDLWVTEVAENSVPYNYTTKDKFNQDLVDNKVLQIGYFKTAYQESDGKPVTIAWQNVLVKSTDWVASTEFADFPYEAKIELTDFVDYTTVPQVVFDIDDTMSGNYAPICKSGDKCVYIYGKVQDEITLKTVITFAPNVNGASVTGGGYNNRGKWQASATYEIDDLVYTDNGQYVCIEGITSTTSPEQDTQHWQATFIATGKTKNALKFSGQDNGTGVQKTFDGSQAVEVAFDENTMTAKEVNGVLKVGAKGTIPEALPQEASALKNGSLPTSGWDTTPKTLYDGPITYGRYGSGGRIYENFLPPFEYSAHTALSDWQGTQLSGNSISNVSALEGGVKLAVRRSDGNDNYVLRIYNTGTVNAWTYNDRDTNGTAQIKVTFLSNWLYTISDTSITANSDVLMELTDDGGVKSYSMEAGKMTVFRNTLPTQAIPYTYKVKQTNASGQFTLVNHYVPSKTSELTNDSGFITQADVPTTPTSLPVTYKKVSGELPISGWITPEQGWKQNTLPANRKWNRVTYGDGKYVAVAFDSDKGAYSTDGITWTEMSMPANRRWFGVAYGDGKFVAVASTIDKGAYSTDGITWTEMTLPASQRWECLTYGGGKFVTVAVNSMYGAYSTDGITWTQMTLPKKKDWSNVTYGDGKFVAVSNSVSSMGAYSIDGITWTETTLPSKLNWRSVTYGNGKFVALAANTQTSSTALSAYSTDGINWTETNLSSSGSWVSVTYGDGKFVAIIFNTNKGAYSADGISWTEFTLPASSPWYEVTYGNGKFVAVAANTANGVYQNTSSKSTYVISDTSITANTSVKMYLTDEGGVKAKSKANGSITVIRDTVPTTSIPYEYEVEQTSAEGLFEVINAYVPDVPTVPTKTSELENDSNFATTSDIPTKTSQLTNDSGFITNADIPTVPTKTSQLENDSGFLTTADIPTKTSQLENDSNFVTTSDIPTSLPQLSGTGVYDPFGTSTGENGDWKPNGTVIASSVTLGWGAGTHNLGTYSGDKTKLTEIVVKRDRLSNHLNVIVPRTSVADGVYTYTKTDEDNTTFTITINANNEITYTVTGERAYTTYWLQENNTTWYSTRKTLVYDASSEVWNADAIVEVNDGGGLKLYYKNELNLYFSRPKVPSSPIPCTYKVRQTSGQGQIVIINQYDGIGNIDGEWSEYIYPNVTLTEAGLYEIYAQSHDAFVYWDGKKLTKKLLRVSYNKAMDAEQTDVQRIYLDVDTIQITSEGVLSIEEANSKYSLEGALITFGSSFSGFKYRKIK